MYKYLVANEIQGTVLEFMEEKEAKDHAERLARTCKIAVPLYKIIGVVSVSEPPLNWAEM